MSDGTFSVKRQKLGDIIIMSISSILTAVASCDLYLRRFGNDAYTTSYIFKYVCIDKIYSL